MTRDTRIVGTDSPRRDAWAKITGRVRFLGDDHLPGAWVGGIVPSPVARGILRGLRRDPGFDWSGVVFVTAADLPGPNSVAMVRDDYPLLAGSAIEYRDQPLALIAAQDAATLAAAIAAVEPDIEELEPLLTIEDSLAGRIVVWGDDNAISDYTIERGDIAAGFAAAVHVVDGLYRTGYQEHMYLEPQAVRARPGPDGGIVVEGSMQCPYYVHRALTLGLALPPEKVRVIQSPTGGAFGGKEDYPSVLAMQASVLALAADRPVEIFYGRHEDVLLSTKRHPSRVSHRTGIDADGRLLAADIDLVLDAGAFTSLSPVVLSRAILHATGVYNIPNARIRGRATATNTPPSGAFRGFGVPQAVFAIERQMDRIAAELGIEPDELRRRNLLREGDSFPYGQSAPDPAGAELVLDRALELTGYRGKRAEPAPEGRLRRGIGLSLFLHGGGFTGDGEDRIDAKVKIVSRADGGVDILVSSVEMGQGASTVLPMIVAEALGLPAKMVRHLQPDTAVVPDSGPTVASRTTMVVGKVLVEACGDLATRAAEVLAEVEGLEPDTITFVAGRFVAGDRDFGDFAAVSARIFADRGEIAGHGRYSPPAGQQWDQATHHGAAYQAYSWGCNVVEAEVDLDTMEVRPTRMTAVIEVGRAIHPVLAAGQVEGGVLQALGWGHMEEMKSECGRYVNDRMATYLIPTSLDAPRMMVEFAEMPTSRGPWGAKGLGELPMNGGAPALLAAIENATGIAGAEAPLTAERLMALGLSAPARKEPR